MSVLLPLSNRTRQAMALMVTGTVCLLLITSCASLFYISIVGQMNELTPSLTLLIGTIFGFVSTFLGVSAPAAAVAPPFPPKRP